MAVSDSVTSTGSVPLGAPVSWSDCVASSEDPASGSIKDTRKVGFEINAIAGATWLPDDAELLGRAVGEDGRSFNGAFVPLVLHDSALAERSYDAAEWAADLISTNKGRCLGIMPFAEREWATAGTLSPRQWNHTAAMIERLEELCGRYRLRAGVRDVVAGREIREDGGIDPAFPLHFVLDTGRFLADGFVPSPLTSPEAVSTEGGAVSDRVKDFLRQRGSAG